MDFTLYVQSEAIFEIQAAFAWYEDQKEGLGYELLKEIEVCYQSLASNPLRYPYIDNNFRRIKTDRFPYILMYEIENTTVFVTRLRHVKQNR